MNKYLMGIQVIKVYNIEIEAENEDEAIDRINLEATTEYIEKHGDLVNVETDYPVVIKEV